MVSFILCAALLLRKLGFDLRSLHRVTSPKNRNKTIRVTDHEITIPYKIMPTLPNYLGVSQIQNESPGLSYESPNLLVTKENAHNTSFHSYLG